MTIWPEDEISPSYDDYYPFEDYFANWTNDFYDDWDNCMAETVNIFEEDYYEQDQQYDDMIEAMERYKEELDRKEDFINREYYLPVSRKDWRELRIKMDVRDFCFKRPQKRHHEDKLKRQFMTKRRQARKHKHDLCYGNEPGNHYAELFLQKMEEQNMFDTMILRTSDQLYVNFEGKTNFNFENVTGKMVASLSHKSQGQTWHQLLGYKKKKDENNK